MRLAPSRKRPKLCLHMFRNNPLGSILVCVLFLLALGSCWIAVVYHFSTKEAYELMIRNKNVLQTKAEMQKLVNETLEYSRNHPDIHPLLRQFNLQPRPPFAQQQQPAAAPPPAQSPPARPAR